MLFQKPILLEMVRCVSLHKHSRLLSSPSWTNIRTRIDQALRGLAFVTPLALRYMLVGELFCYVIYIYIYICGYKPIACSWVSWKGSAGTHCKGLLRQMGYDECPDLLRPWRYSLTLILDGKQRRVSTKELRKEEAKAIHSAAFAILR